MKKFLLQFLFLMLVLPGMSQTIVYVDGYVIDSITGNPIPNHAVTIVSDSSGGFVYYNTVYSNASGWYNDSIPAGVTYGILYIRTYDCNQDLHTETVYFDPSNLYFTVNFNICNSNAPCEANFYYYQYADRLFYFMDNSTGNPSNWYWNFGDGGNSTEQNPYHQYAANGWYSVTLTIANPSTGCTSAYTADVYANDSTGGGCQAYYTYYADSANSNMVHFFDQSQGNILYWSWNFGDPGSGANNTSGLQNASHIFTGPGTYSVCLTIQGADSTCFDTYCQNIVINGGGGCQAYFYMYPDSLNNPPYTYNFIDQSSGNISTWTWSFGDGTTQTIAFPANPNVTHSYAQPGNYGVCLMIQGIDSTCFDYHCDTLFVGSGGGCQADFTYYSAGTNTIQFLNYSTGTNGPWYWTFGDGGTSTLRDPFHTYPAPGYYFATLTIGALGTNCYDTAGLTVYVNDSTGGGCQAAFAVVPDSMNMPPYSYHFIDQSSGNIAYWFWSFGDGQSSSEQSPYHTYQQPGVYSVCLSVIGADSTCYDIACDSLLVGNATGCQAMFTYTINPATGNNAVQFSDQSTGNPVSWLWYFGDSTYSTAQNPFHFYPGPGTYYACLTITGNNCTSTWCQEVTIVDSTFNHHVYGQVFAGNIPIQLGLALIFSLDSGLNYMPYIGISVIDSMGFYSFEGVPDGNYLVYAIPLDSNGYLPTYYGDVLDWTEATVIVLGQPSNPYDIHLLEAAYMPAGPASVSGEVSISGLKSSYLDKMVMLITDEAGNVVSFDRVSGSGTFGFPTLAYGTYYIYGEMAGITSQHIKVVLTPENPHADIVMTLSGKNILGISDMNQAMEAGVIYPNPASDRINIVMNLKAGETVRVEIFNQMGQMISSMNKSLDRGKTLLTLPLQGMAPGFYNLRISSEKGMNISRKLLIAR
jgi:PKD repeat protein